jgi:hypothetical protein
MAKKAGPAEIIFTIIVVIVFLILVLIVLPWIVSNFSKLLP